MPGPFDLNWMDPSVVAATGGGMGGMMSPFGLPNDPEFRRQLGFQALTNAGLGLMAASSPSASPVPASIGSMFGGLAGGAASGLQNMEDRYLKRAMTGAQLAMAQQKVKQLNDWQKLFSGAGDAAPAAPAAPSATPASDPTNPAGTSPSRDQFIAMMTPHVLEASKATGLDPRLIMAQAALETGFGAAAPGNNYFGVKSHGMPGGQTLATTEAGPNGMVPTVDSFRSYSSPAASARDYVDFLKTNDRYKPLLGAQGFDAQIDALGKSGYATDPQYAAKVKQLAMSFPALDGGAQSPAGMPGATPVQYTPPAAQTPKTFAQVVQSMPPAVRQMVGVMGPEKGLPLLMKYADPETVPAFDPRSGQMVFVPKTALGNGQYQPVEAGNFALAQQREKREGMNADVIPGADGKPQVNQTVLDFKKGVSAAQGTDPASKITVDLAQDAIKRNSDIQKSGLTAQGNINRLGTLQTLLDQIATNKFKGSTTELKAAAKAAGIDLDALGVKDDVGVTQAAAALTNLMALENRQEMPGPMSNADRDFLTAAAPSITKDPAGNRVLIAIKRGDLQRQVDIAKFAREYISSPEFKRNPEGLDNYVASKIEGKSYFDPSVLPKPAAPQGKPGSLPMPNPDGTPRVRRWNLEKGALE